jgi:hypothetical protein
MRVLVACEFSGVVRDAFRRRGHEAWSNDLLPGEGEFPNYHLQGDCMVWIAGPNALPWDLLIAHPPCTHLSVSGARWFKDKQVEQQAALVFVGDLLAAPVPRIAVENPIGIISTRIRKPDQITQPYEYGHPESKKTCLWLKGLPKLVPTDILPLPSCGYWDNQTPSGQNKLGPSPDRWKLRSITYQGIADAMADQWGI